MVAGIAVQSDLEAYSPGRELRRDAGCAMINGECVSNLLMAMHTMAKTGIIIDEGTTILLQ